jgi:Carboxypeptidase regulatory-like domain/TonB dependent receptor-like, beta-barrel
MRVVKSALWIVGAIVMTTGVTSAQTTTGTITGRVVDSQSLPVPGVSVTVQGVNLRGTTTVVTQANGDYIVPLLPPGPYTVTFELGGFTRQQKAVTVASTQTLPLNVTMDPAGLTETVTVVGQSPVLTQTAQVATNFNQELIAMLPTNRDINATVLRAPAVHPTGPNGAYSIAGAMSFESLFMVNGVSVSENLRGQPFALYIEDAIQETTVATSGISAEYGRFSGGVINVITKSGTNRFSGSFRDTLYNDYWRSLVTGNSNFAPLAAGRTTPACNTVTGIGGTQIPDPHCFGADTRVDKVVPQYEYTFGGPVVRDWLTFFTAGRFIDQQFSRNTIAPLLIPYAAENNRKRYEIKLTGSVTSNHRIDGSWIKESLDQINDTFQLTTSMDLASLYNRSTPQDLFTVNYRANLTPQFFFEGRFSLRHFTFVGSGSPYTDLIKGTLLLDRQRGGRYWSPTFCGVCDNEKRDNDEEYVKGTYFMPTRNGGSHNMVFGYDRFNDKRFANNHQSGSDYRINGTTSIIRDGVIYPSWQPGSSTILQYNPILVGTEGTNFRTHSVFFNDNWRWNNRVTLNLGVRWDKNQGANGQGDDVVKDSAFSPRVGIVWDPKGNGQWSVSGSVGRYVAAIANGIADDSSAGGNSALFQYQYSGPAINPDVNAPTSSLVDSATAIQRMFDWCNRDSQGLCRQPIANSSIPGVSLQIADNLMSPNVMEYAGGISRQFGNRAVVRADYTFRNYRDFYASQIDLTTGTVVDPFGNRADLEIYQNIDALERRYSGVTISANYRLSRTEFGGNYTLSRLWGNFIGENTGSGPLTSTLLSYPEYHQDAWFVPIGNLEADQRHRASLWINYGVPRVSGLTLSLLQDLASGTPYGAEGTVDARPYVPSSIASRYATPQGGTTEMYFYTDRDAFRTESNRRTDFAVNYTYGIGVGARKLDAFVQAQIINLFNLQDLCACGAADVFANGGASAITRIGTSVLSPANSTAMARFDPLSQTPVLGTNWNYNPNFGTPLNRQAFTTPRTYRLSFGVRF